MRLWVNPKRGQLTAGCAPQDPQNPAFGASQPWPPGHTRQPSRFVCGPWRRQRLHPALHTALLATALLFLHPTATPAAAPACAHAARALAPGLTVERVPGVTPRACLTIVRVDPAFFRLRILTAAFSGSRAHGDGRGARAAPDWARDFHATGAINTSMYLPSGRSIGLLRSAELVDHDRDNRALGAVLAFDPVDPRAPALAMFGRGCPGFDLAAIRRRYRGLVQAHRLLDCQGTAVPWKDPRAHSAAAIAVDRRGHLVLAHSSAPLTGSDFARRLADPTLALTGAMFVEGGKEASLYVRGSSEEVREIGRAPALAALLTPSYWPIPNVLTFSPR